jgi:hypothetical protein
MKHGASLFLDLPSPIVKGKSILCEMCYEKIPKSNLYKECKAYHEKVSKLLEKSKQP